MSTLRPRPLCRIACVLLAAISISLGGCGGSGGGGAAPADPGTPPSGLTGTVQLPDVELGRIAELEPNDSPAQAHLLAPIFPRTSMEIAGLAAANDTDLGAIDTLDVYRFQSTADQDVALSLTSRAIGGVAPALDIEVFDFATGTSIASTMGGPEPLVTTFGVAGGSAYDIQVRISAGAASYVLEIALADGAGQTKPVAPSMLLRMPMPAPSTAPTMVAAGDPACACDRVLVQLAEGVDPEAFCDRHDLQLGRRLASGTWCLGYAHETASEGRRTAVALAAELADCEGVLSAEPDWIVKPLAEPGDPLYGGQWNLHAVGCEPAWDITTGDADVVIGVVDAGILPDHPDFTDRLEPGYDFISDAAVALDGDGRDLDPSDPGDRFLPSGLSSWHGSHVAGICVANQDDHGITGVAPGCRVMALRALGLGGGFVSDVADAILFGAGLFNAPGRGTLPQPLRILNLSIGLNIDSTELRSACERAFNRGVFLVGATGNTGQAVLFPARYSTVFAVAAVDARLTSTAYSNFGSEVDLAAPGGLSARDFRGRGWPDHIVSTSRDETVFPATDHYMGLQGTSHAVPHVAGAAALLLSINPLLTSTDLRTILKNTALDVGAPGFDVAHGSGLLQIHRAVKRALELSNQPRSDEPILVLPTRSVSLVGFDTLATLPISNGGGGTLAVTAAQSSTDDGSPWLSASLVPAPQGSDTNVSEIAITVDRNGLPDGRYSGTLRLANPDGVLGAVRVILYVDRFPRVGRLLRIAAIEEATGIARRVTPVFPEHGYRFLLTGLPESFYLLQAGEDLDEDGFFCEPADYCTWWGGPMEADAVPIRVRADEPAVGGLDLLLLPPSGS